MTVAIPPVAASRAQTKVERWTRVSVAFAVATIVLVVLLALLPFWFGPNTTEKLTELFVLIILAAMGTHWPVTPGSSPSASRPSSASAPTP
jgi:branched-chain amino acid transport system permease protein